MRALFKTFAFKIFAVGVIYLQLIFLLHVFSPWGYNRVLLWNVFLALLPLVFSALTCRSACRDKGKWMAYPLGFLWLIFFPNAPYMVTDLKHIAKIDFYTPDRIFPGDLMPWIRTIAIGSGYLIALLAGMCSLYIIRALLMRKGKIFANLATGVICVLSGFGIYLGRFPRINSWDIFDPSKFLWKFSQGIDLFAVGFSLLIALYIGVAFVLFALLRQSSPDTYFLRDSTY